MMLSRRTFLQVAGLGTAAAALGRVTAQPARAQSERPNIVIILADDQDTGTLDATMTEGGQVVPVMRHLLSGRGGGWTRFDNAICNQSICAPSRASLLTGRYARHHGVLRNGLICRMVDRDHTLPRWLHDAGYFTALKGKYTYGKGDKDAPRPAGWDVWEPGGGYSSAVFPRGAQLIRQVATDTPLFLCLWPVDPHKDARPQPQYAGRAITLPPDSPSLNEADVSDKPRHVRAMRLMGPGRLGGLREERRQACRALIGIDDGVKLIMDALEDTGRLDNTIIVYAGDHGYLWGEHRMTHKDKPYVGCMRFPLLIRDPAQAGNRREGRMVSNVDIAPTLAGYAGVAPDVAIDGRDLRGMMRGGAWDERVVIEKNTPAPLVPGTFHGVFTVMDGTPWCYVEHGTGEVELYDLAADPDQMESLHGRPEYAAVREALAAQMEAD